MNVRYLGNFYRVVNITFLSRDNILVTFQDGATLRMVQLNHEEFLRDVSTTAIA
jgi:hypothetical protein